MGFAKPMVVDHDVPSKAAASRLKGAGCVDATAAANAVKSKAVTKEPNAIRAAIHTVEFDSVASTDAIEKTVAMGSASPTAGAPNAKSSDVIVWPESSACAPSTPNSDIVFNDQILAYLFY